MDTSTRDANEKERIKPLLQLIIDKKWDPEEVINHCRQLITDKKWGDAFLLIKHGIGIPHCLLRFGQIVVTIIIYTCT